jgi:hypothetical protein
MSVPVVLYTTFDFLCSNGWKNSDYGVTIETPNNPELGQLFFFQFIKQNPIRVGKNRIATITIKINTLYFDLIINGWIGVYYSQIPIDEPDKIITALQRAIQVHCPILKPSD